MFNGYKTHTVESLSDANIHSRVLENIFTGNDGGIGYNVFAAANGSGEGLSRFDIMRFKSGIDRRNTDLSQTSNIYKISASDNILLWQIPQVEIEANA